jgi:hypothetical protein
MASERPVRVFAYRQVHPCDAVAYHLALRGQFGDSPLLRAGELALDAATGQIVSEERNVYAGNPGKKAPCVAHMILSYDNSPFGILVPKTIVVETFLPLEGVNGMNMGFQPYARMVQTYGPDPEDSRYRFILPRFDLRDFASTPTREQSEASRR